MEGNVRKVLSGVGFYGTLAVCLAIVGVCGWLLLSGGEEPAGQTQVTPQIPVSQPVEMPEKTVEQPVETLKPEPAVQEAASEPPAADPAPAAAEAPRLIVEPLRGEVLTAFSMEELVYNQTLGDWRTHDGVDIAADSGAAVLAACGGTVQAVTEDPLLGTTVVLAHDDGYQTTYATLQPHPDVAAGEEVCGGGKRYAASALCRLQRRESCQSRRVSGELSLTAKKRAGTHLRSGTFMKSPCRRQGDFPMLDRKEYAVSCTS